MRLAVTYLVVVLVAGACTIQERTDRVREEPPSTHRQIVQPGTTPSSPLFSAGVRSGDLIFLSGMIGAVPGVSPARLADGGIRAEARQALDNIVDVLGAAGATLDDVVKCTVFLADIDEYGAMNEVYAEYFPEDPPARSTVAGSGLALGARIEIECVAAAPAGS